MNYEHLFSPITLRDTTFETRIFMDSMLDHPTEKDLEKYTDHYVQKCIEGIGLIIIGRAAVTMEESSGSNFMSIAEEKNVENFKKLIESVHESGGKIALQLFQPGPSQSIGQYQIMPEKDIYQMIEAFAEGARRTKEAGFDAVEIAGSDGYLINQFLSSLSNKRKDKWGRTFENRMHFPLAVARHVRSYVGEHFPVIYRIPGFTLSNDSTTEKDILHLAKQLKYSGTDLLNIGIGWNEKNLEKSIEVPERKFLHLAEQIKSYVSISIGITKQMTSMKSAEEAAAKGITDMTYLPKSFTNQQKSNVGERKSNKNS
ncbi:hypothetical protein [Alteribacillus bidgolensis]|uniref:2,4-dienoyl-CoA reductase (NADPH2) n=1 Tax=Alteribacillus bidgolensis TaxID=930129 RepID=A0A1G8LVB2_9BACI|nr:hypothetical protein [Alteribacillus bidgolensis]SDI59634.1 2,4-dienoyl-CoA reductase (NADPH2) [Alteribacillus bidgolensis]